MKEIMIDIETLDTKTSAVVLSIGLVKFGDWESDASIFYPSVLEQLRKGRTVSTATQSWWGDLPGSVADKAFAEDMSRPYAWVVAEGMGKFCEGAETYWANGAHFDIAILESLFGQDNVPWKYYQARDMRTLREESGMDRKWKPSEELQGEAHDPIYDCRYQIAVVQEARRRLLRPAPGTFVPVEQAATQQLTGFENNGKHL